MVADLNGPESVRLSNRERLWKQIINLMKPGLIRKNLIPLVGGNRNQLTQGGSMNPFDFINTIYLGDRTILSINIDGSRNLVKICIDEISRLKEGTDSWNYYNDENIINGFIVFDKVKSFDMSPNGPLPNDYVEFGSVTLANETLDNSVYYKFEILAGSVAENGKSTDIVITIIAQNIYIEPSIEQEFGTRNKSDTCLQGDFAKNAI